MKPKRIQLSRKKGWRLPPNTVVVSRPAKYGNPHRIGFCPACGVTHTRNEALAEFDAELNQLPKAHLAELRGKDLACWCPLDKPCHADILLTFANL